MKKFYVMTQYLNIKDRSLEISSKTGSSSLNTVCSYAVLEGIIYWLIFDV